jgi:opacity protein-like surface antigen
MLKSLLLASALTMALSGTAMASDVSSPSTGGCTSCALPTSNANAPVKLAQVQMQAQQAPGRQAIRGDGDQGDVKKTDCCPPVTENKALIGSSFSHHQMSGENTTMHYGQHYVPNATFNNQMKLWAPYATSAYAAPGWTGLAIVMGGEMRTDAPTAIPVDYTTHPFMNNWAPTATDFQGGMPIKTSFLSAWFFNSWDIHANSAFDDQVAGWADPGYHMTPDGRRYMMGLSYYIYERRIGGQEYRIRKIDCGEDMQLNWRLNFKASKLAAGAKPNVESLVGIAKLNTPMTLAIDPKLAEYAKSLPQRSAQ